MESPSDEVLIRDLAGGEEGALQLLVTRHQGAVRGWLAKRLVIEDAEEAAQDTFLKLFRKRDLYDVDRALEPWLLRIAGNTSRDMARRRRTAALPGAREHQGQSALELLEDVRLSQRSQQEVTSQAVRQEIERMSERIRVPLELRYLNGLTNVEIAEVLEISLSSVKQRLARGKDLLQSRLHGVMKS